MVMVLFVMISVIFRYVLAVGCRSTTRYLRYYKYQAIGTRT